MKRTFLLGTAMFCALGSVACGGSEGAGSADDSAAAPAAAPAAAAPAAASTMPSWFRVDGNNVAIDVVAGATSDGNYWNYNGSLAGAMTITVPEGANVTINFRNDDPNMAHSLGISPMQASPPATPTAEPVFEGAISQNPTSMTDATMTGETETITFTASQAGEYMMLCYIPGHAISGMWVHFVVGGEAGVTGAPDVEISM